ncbi:MAG: chemotaxis-specific protein-glutamate methyltransferase CheB [Holophagales bacterium]|nr:chemotaxis-specific protein-glutamate methyltransferase CheB [Holophagales bacterium]MBK9965303.1 chemotaxis-specific protein-glutamate methyltransferase CheB [Holophagales bacterium]
MIEVLVVEDSRVIRDYLVYVLETDPQIRVGGTAGSGEEALASVARHRPDVILMDIHLPGIDGFETTRRIMSSNPVPIVVCTASTQFDQVQTAMRALEAGALAALRKPRGLGDAEAEADGAAIINTLKAMSAVRVVRRWARATDAEPAAAEPMFLDAIDHQAALVAIGASIGGPPAIMQILSDLSPSFAAPILVVQHIAAGFTAGFAEWLGSASPLPVHLAVGGVHPLPGHVYVAPDDHHLRVGLLGELQTTRDAPDDGLRPSVAALFRSVARHFGHRSVGVLLTGMGRDGAEELKLLADRGALTVAQDEASCVVFGMPDVAIRLGAARFVLPPQKIAQLLTTAVRRGASKGDADG